MSGGTEASRGPARAILTSDNPDEADVISRIVACEDFAVADATADYFEKNTQGDKLWRAMTKVIIEAFNHKAIRPFTILAQHPLVYSVEHELRKVVVSAVTEAASQLKNVDVVDLGFVVEHTANNFDVETNYTPLFSTVHLTLEATDKEKPELRISLVGIRAFADYTTDSDMRRNIRGQLAAAFDKLCDICIPNMDELDAASEHMSNFASPEQCFWNVPEAIFVLLQEPYHLGYTVLEKGATKLLQGLATILQGDPKNALVTEDKTNELCLKKCRDPTYKGGPIHDPLGVW